jgi:PAS domain S-box-containing protein
LLVHRSDRVLSANRAMNRLLGHSREDALEGVPLADISDLEESSLAGTSSLWETARALDQPAAEAPLRHTRMRHADGTMIATEMANISIDFDGVPAFLMVAHDVTERDHMSARVAAVDRMVAVGTLAAGAAHEINNPLAYVAANAEFVRRKLVLLRAVVGEVTVDANGAVIDLLDMDRALEESGQGVERVRDIVDKLRAMSRADGETRRPVHVEDLVETSLRMANNEIRHRARVRVRFGKLPRVMGNETRLTQVFLNLLLNAAQAIREGAAAENEIAIKGFVDKGMVVVETKDSGSGIPLEDQPRIWDPFFTTRPVGAGNGLGLFVCRANVEALGGRIFLVASKPGSTTMRVELPALTTVERATVPPPPRGIATNPEGADSRYR